MTEPRVKVPAPFGLTKNPEEALLSVPFLIVKLLAPVMLRPPVVTVAVLPLVISQILLPAVVSMDSELSAAAVTVLVISSVVLVRKSVVELAGLPAVSTAKVDDPVIVMVASALKRSASRTWNLNESDPL